jgi:hypothetical protein
MVIRLGVTVNFNIWSGGKFPRLQNIIMERRYKMRDQKANKHKEKLTTLVESEVTRMFERVLDIAEVAVGDDERY